MARSASGTRSRIVTIGVLAFGVILLLVLVSWLGSDSTDEPAETTATETAVDEAAAPTADDLGLSRRVDGDVTALGALDAPVVMLEYADYRCPFCAVFSRETMPRLVEEYVDTGLVRYEWRDLPLFGQESIDAAVAARAAGEQGMFWEYHAAIFDAAPEQGRLAIDRASILAFANQIGVPDLVRFEQDLDNPVLLAAVQQDAIQGQQIGASSTPAFIVGATPVLGAQPVEVFRQIIEDELARAANGD